ncbi:hypothetical protein G6F43_013530 [Rhizopus delemar]|nr:hypothetical protein G6F43_013530 [Rhizopus delemar]
MHDLNQLNLEADESEMIVCYTTSTTNNDETAEDNIDETEENDNTEQDEQRVDIVECKKRLREAYESILMYKVLLDDLDLYSQLRFCGSQLLAGAIIIEKQTSILVNTVGLYARDPLLDTHYERSPTKSYFPTEPVIYGHIRICLLDSPDGKKLVLGTRVQLSDYIQHVSRC